MPAGRELEAYASQASKKLDFNTPEEAEAVEEVFTNAIQCLSEARKPSRNALPVSSLLQLAERLQ